MGTPGFAVGSLNALAEAGLLPIAVVTVPDKPVGRGLKLAESAVKQRAKELSIPHILQPESLKDPAFAAELQALNPDIAVVVAFRILPQTVYSIPRLGSFNLHASLLPDYRGAAPLNWALINGEQQTGVTTFLLQPTVDTGDILLQRSLDIRPEWNAGHLHDALMELGAGLVVETTQGLWRGTLKAQPQPTTPHLHAAPKLTPENTMVDWNQSTVQIHNLVRGLSPHPTAWTEWEGKQIKLLSTRPLVPSEISHQGQLSPGQFVLVNSIGGVKGKVLAVGTGDGALMLDYLKPEGQREMKGLEFWNGLGKLQQEVERHIFHNPTSI
jgi:methionyl-tRNA formyltransferase